jgi:hypothetical protein
MGSDPPPENADRSCVRTITIAAPQQEHRIGARSFIHAINRPASNFSTRCSKAIRRLQLGCRNPKLRARRHDQMDMRVIIQPARVRMQHRNGAGRALQLLVVLAERAYRLPTAAHQQRVENALLRKGQRPEFGRQGKRHQEILGGHLFLHRTRSFDKRN